MLTKSRLFIFLAVTAFSAGSLQAQEPPPGCPQDLEALSNWWVTTPDIGHVVEIRAWLTFTNITDGDVEFEPDANEKLQIWSIPGVMDPSPVVFSSWPTGITPPGENYSYDVTMGIADLPTKS
jgi:hypothetical protein